MRGADPRIHRKSLHWKRWIAGSSPAMTAHGLVPPCRRLREFSARCGGETARGGFFLKQRFFWGRGGVAAPLLVTTAPKTQRARPRRAGGPGVGGAARGGGGREGGGRLRAFRALHRLPHARPFRSRHSPLPRPSVSSPPTGRPALGRPALGRTALGRTALGRTAKDRTAMAGGSWAAARAPA